MDHHCTRIRWIRRQLIFFLFLAIPFGMLSRPAFSQQICSLTTPDDGECQQNGFPDCYHCTAAVTGAPQCSPNDTVCQGISGGSTDNLCRTAVCLPNATPGVTVNSNPSGCDYNLTTGTQCTLCATPAPSTVNHCGNGICEVGLGETCGSCPADCTVPGFGSSIDNTGDSTCPLVTNTPPPDFVFSDVCIGNAGITFITFSGGPPFNETFNECEDGDLCTDNFCDPNVSNQCDSTPKACSINTADFCCPAGCNPPASGGTCGPNDSTCDIDCYPPLQCQPTPIPTPIPTPTPPVLGLCLQGDGVMSGNNGNLNCKGFTCSLDPTASESPASAMGLAVFGGLFLTLALKKRRSLE